MNERLSTNSWHVFPLTMLQLLSQTRNKKLPRDFFLFQKKESLLFPQDARKKSSFSNVAKLFKLWITLSSIQMVKYIEKRLFGRPCNFWVKWQKDQVHKDCFNTKVMFTKFLVTSVKHDPNVRRLLWMLTLQNM